VATHFTTHPFFLKSKHIACYWGCQNEMSTMPLIQAIWQANKICYLPVLRSDSLLSFVRYDEDDKLKLNKFFIPEPENTLRIIDPLKLDVIIAPLLAFDSHGHRLGMGGGYYDRTLAFKKDVQNKSPILIGLGYAAQQAILLPTDSWDILLNAVMTEKAITTIG
jgi:5-formyltetrahydrofolate cyclo-ligase